MPVFVRISTEIRTVFRSTEMQWSNLQNWNNQKRIHFSSSSSFNRFASWSRTMSDRVDTCGVQISRRSWKKLLIFSHLEVYRQEVRHKNDTRFAFLCFNLLCADFSIDHRDFIDFSRTRHVKAKSDDCTRNERTCHLEYRKLAFRRTQNFGARLGCS